MSNARRKQLPFKISARTVRMLGRQNVSNQYVAVIELIKNSYDADSPSVVVSFHNAGTDQGVITIRDTGSGMDEQALTNRWMMIGTDYKEREPVSLGGRVRTGAKGIGRFAMDRLGRVGTLSTFQSPEKDGLRLTIDWSKYDDPGDSFESVHHELDVIPNTENTQGTTIEVTGLHDRWHQANYQALYEDLVFLIPPLKGGNADFSIILKIDEHPELSGPVMPLARTAAEYELQSTLSSGGAVRHVLRHYSGEERVTDIDWVELDPQPSLFEARPACGPVQATVLFYLRESNADRRLDFRLGDLRRYLDTFRGIRLYRDGFQIKPYGSRGNDWLGLDSRKQRSPEGVGQELGRWKVSNNQLIGTVHLSRISNPTLQDRTSREGLVENQAFADLRTFLMSGLEFLELERQHRARRPEEDVVPEPIKESVDAIVAVVDRIKVAGVIADESASGANTDTLRPIESTQPLARVKSVIVPEADVQALAQQAGQLQSTVESALREIQLLRALATLGIALATFSHEIRDNILSVLDEAALLRPLLDHLPREKQHEAWDRLATAVASAERVENWSIFVLERLKKNRRIEQEIRIGDLVDGVLRPFERSFAFRSIRKEVRVAEDIPSFKGFPLDYEAILINLVTNSVKALEKVPKRRRLIQIRVTYRVETKQLEINFEDSGRGLRLEDLPLPDLGIAQVFQPFVSSKDSDGTGMGLAVIDRIIRDLRGQITLTGTGALGGAHFLVVIPIAPSETPR